MTRPVRKVVANRIEDEKKAKELAIEKKNAKKLPKRSLTGYQLFMKDVRSQIVKDNPNAGFGEITRLIAQMWKDCAEAERNKYLEMAKEAKEKFVKPTAAASSTK